MFTQFSILIDIGDKLGDLLSMIFRLTYVKQSHICAKFVLNSYFSRSEMPGCKWISVFPVALYMTSESAKD